MNIDFTPFYLSLKLAFISTAILFFLVMPLAFWLSRASFRFKPALEAVIAAVYVSAASGGLCEPTEESF